MRDLIVKLAGAIIRRLPNRLSRALQALSRFLNRIAETALLQEKLAAATRHRDHASLLREIVGQCGDKAAYLEFGVWQGESMKIAIDAFEGRDVDFFGFDSFEGLPGDWNRYFGSRMDAGAFDTGGRPPDIAHERLRFIKGWFEQTLPGFLRTRPEIGDPERDVVLYLDADLYDPTLLVLHRIAGCRDRFFVLCDDWTGGTGEAVAAFARTSGFQMTFFGQVCSEIHGLPKKASLLLRADAGAAK